MAERTTTARRPHDAVESQWVEQVISIDRVARVVKGGRRFRFRALVAVGDGKKQVGVGVAKGSDVQMAITKAVTVAKRSLITVPIKNGTIPHEVDLKYGGAHVIIKPAAPGTGVIAGGVVRTVLDATALQNVLSKSLGSNNKINNAYATIEALRSLVPREKWITTKQRDVPQAKSSTKKVKKSEEQTDVKTEKKT